MRGFHHRLKLWFSPPGIEEGNWVMAGEVGVESKCNVVENNLR